MLFRSVDRPIPPSAKAGVRVPCQVGNIDLSATVLALVGASGGGEGVSRVAELGGGECREESVWSSTVAGRLMAEPPTDHSLRGQGRKLIRHENGSTELYELGPDPAEATNLAPNEVSAAMSKLVEARMAGQSPQSPELDAGTSEMLKSLGYVDGG